MTEEHCPLCQLEKLSKWWREYPDYVIVDCVTCTTSTQHVPMAVLRAHQTKVGPWMRLKMTHSLMVVADEVYGRGNWYADDSGQQVPDHYHIHARKKEDVEGQ